MKHSTTFISAIIALLVSPNIWATTTSENEDYPIVFDKLQDYTHASRRLNSVSLLGSADGDQTLQLPTPLKVYSLINAPHFSAQAGERVTAKFGFSGTWMNGFVYIDCNQNGQFEATINADGTRPDDSEAVAFSYAEPTLNSGKGYNSNGTVVSNTDVLNPPTFTIPAHLKNGCYRMRYKVDWASIDPAGRAEDGNGILKNGGAICDVVLNIHSKKGKLSTIAEHGALLTENNEPLPAEATFGKPLTLKVVPEEGYTLDALKIKHGHNLDGEAIVHGVAQYEESLIPAFLLNGDLIQIPAEQVDGDVQVEAIFIKKVEAEDGSGYALSFDKDATATSAYTATIKLNFSTKTTSLKVDNTSIYNDLTGQEVAVYRPNKLKATITDNREDLHYYLYADLNNDGCFTPMLNADGTPSQSSELVAFTAFDGKDSQGAEAIEGNKVLNYALPEALPEGVYRMRLKADVNNLSPKGSEAIITNGGGIIDFLVNITRNEKTLKLTTVDGSIFGTNNTALPRTITPLSDAMTLVLQPGATGFKAKEVIVRHGHNLGGEAYVNGNQQWSEKRLTPSNNKVRITNQMLNGDVEIYALFEAPADNEWQLVFSDEFNAADFEQPTPDKWIRCKRYGATWNRWLSDSEKVIYQEDGDLVARAIPNPDTSTDDVPMITGGIKSNTKFGFTYGVVEARILSNPWVGNFPAFWMMPEDQSAGWPDCGEIDIWETIDTQQRSWHTIHSNWTYDLGQTGNPQSSFNVATDLACYHVYRLEWSEDQLVWYVDGKKVGSYARSTKQSDLNQGQWPFNKHFHIILNQSVGNGAWAANADVSHTYETRFDWVRVYQKKGMLNTLGTVGIDDVTLEPTTPTVNVIDNGVMVNAPTPTTIHTYSISGRLLAETLVRSETFIPLASGVYIVGGKKVIIK